MTQPTLSILIIEDEVQIRRFIHASLQRQGFQVIEADSMQQGLTETANQSPDLIILDLGLPDGDGNLFIQTVRHWSKIPIIVLSARNDERDKVRALNAGADDYLSKPFGIAELSARVRANLRRRPLEKENLLEEIQFGDIRIDRVHRVIYRNDEEIHLTQREYQLLMMLVSSPGKVFTHQELLLEVWGQTYQDQSQYIRIYMGHLRQKLEEIPARPRYLQTETGIGYRFVPD